MFRRLHLHLAPFAGVVAFWLGASGCNNGGPDEGAAPARSHEAAAVKAAIVQQLPRAAGLSNPELELLASAAVVPRLESTRNQPLTLALLMLNVDPASPPSASPEQLAEELQMLGGALAPAEIIRRISASSGQGFASVLQPEWIKDVTCQVQGQTASGVIHARAEEFFTARIHYAARRQGDDWIVERFELPLHGVLTVRAEDGMWRASGKGLQAQDFRPPVVAHFLFPDRFDETPPPLLRIARAEASSSGKGLQSLKFTLDAEEFDPENLHAALQRCRAALAQAAEPPTDFHIALAADGKLPARRVEEVLRIIRDAGFQVLRARAEFQQQALPAPSFGSLNLALPPAGLSQRESEFNPPLYVRLVAQRHDDVAAPAEIQVTLDAHPLGEDAAGLEKLNHRLAELFTAPVGADGELTVFVRADETVTWAQWLQAASACSGRFDAATGLFHRFPAILLAFPPESLMEQELEMMPQDDSPAEGIESIEPSPPGEFDPAGRGESPGLDEPPGLDESPFDRPSDLPTGRNGSTRQQS